MTPEGKVKKSIRDWLVAHGLQPAGGKSPDPVRGWFYMPANNGMGVSGIPDFVGSIGPMARFFSIEAKAEGGRVSGPQEARHAEIKSANAIVVVAKGVEDITFLKEFL